MNTQFYYSRTTFLLSLLFILICPANSYSQDYRNMIIGQVFDVDSGLLLGAVNVYLTNTTLGDASDNSGKYQIRNIPPGNYNIVYHFIGYEQVIKNIDIGIKDTLVIDVGLSYTHFELDSIVVEGKRDRTWQRYLERFIQHFIGSSNNAQQTQIINAEVLDFETVRFGVYDASSEHELHIVNEALGYESFVSLEHFEWNFFEDTGQVFYYVRMNELETKDEDQKKEWEQRRLATYNNSIRSFFKGLLHAVDNQPEDERRYRHGLRTFDDFYYNNNRYKILNGTIQKIEDERKLEMNRPREGQYDVFGFKFNLIFAESPLSIISGGGEVSYLDYQNRSAREYIFIIDQNGYLLNPLDVTLGGYWAKYRFADFLPINFIP